MGILKNGNSASNGSIKRNGDVPLGQIDARIEEEDEELEEENKEKPHEPTETKEFPKQDKQNEMNVQHTEPKDEEEPKKQNINNIETDKNINTTIDKGKQVMENKKSNYFSM